MIAETAIGLGIVAVGGFCLGVAAGRTWGEKRGFEAAKTAASWGLLQGASNNPTIGQQVGQQLKQQAKMVPVTPSPAEFAKAFEEVTKAKLIHDREDKIRKVFEAYKAKQMAGEAAPPPPIPEYKIY